MNFRFLTIASLLASSTFFISGCGSDNSSFETPSASNTPVNAGTVSQKNLSVVAADPQPTVYDTTTQVFSTVTMDITVKVGDVRNQLLTDSHTVYFATEWGLINPSCVTENGTCSVTWQTSSFNNIPGDFANTITAYTLGEEAFTDVNGNGIFDDAERASDYVDLEEPFVDANNDGVFNAGDSLIDVVNGLDSTGKNGLHDAGDTFMNSPSCTHSSLCSTVQPTIYTWVAVELNLLGPPATP